MYFNAESASEKKILKSFIFPLIIELKIVNILLVRFPY